MKKFPYTSCFATLTIKPMVSAEKDKCLALASLEDIKGFLPTIDTSVNLDLLPVAFNACVINRVNKNKDVVNTDTAIAMCRHFVNKPINVEHNRQKVIGMILTAGFSEFGTDKILSEEQVKGMTGPFNITLGGIIWRVVCPELADHIEEASDPTSDKYLSVSASWELGFSEYNIVLLDGGAKNLNEAKKIITDAKEVEEIKDKLTSLGGPGKIEDLFAYRMPCNEVLPLGIGFTEKPAAEVKGIVTPSENEASSTGAPSATAPKIEGPLPTVGIVNPDPFPNKIRKESLGENENKISQLVKTNVKTGSNTSMKITSLKDITEDNLKECSASAVSEFIATELTKGSSEWEKQKTALNTQLSEAQAATEKVKASHTELETQLKTMKAQVDALASEKAEREKVEKFNVRMASVAAQYDLDDEVRLAIVEELKTIESDEAFAKWETRAKALFKAFKKKDDKKGDKKDDKAEAEDDMDASKKAKASTVTASTATASAVSDAIENGKTSAGLPNGQSAAEPTLKEKYKEAFARENFVITV